MADTFSGVLHNHGARPKFTDPDTGKVYECAYLDLVAITEFDEWMADRALQLVYRSRDHLTPEEYRQSLKETHAEILAGTHAFGSPKSNQAILSVAGAAKLMEMLLVDATEKRRLTREEFADLFRRRNAELLELLDRVVQMSKPKGRVVEGVEGNVPQPVKAGP